MLKIEHGFCELRKLGLRCAVGCLCEHVEGLRRVELAQKREILRVKIAFRVEPAAGQRHVGRTVGGERAETVFEVQLVKLLEQAAAKTDR